MEVKNRFDLLASLCVNGESIESSSNNIHSFEPKQIDEQQTRNPWDIPEYVEKPIPCLTPLVPKEQTPKSIVVPIKTSRREKKVKPIVDYSKCEEEPEEEEVHIQPTTYPQYPPQPYKFKPSATNHRNETMPKFNRKNNVLPKHTSVRGNSKSCTHQI